MSVPITPARLFDKAQRVLCGRVFVDSGGDHRDAVFLAGSGRGGSTWVSQILNHANRYRYIFEPFHPGKVALCRPFRPRQYLRPEAADPRFLRPAAAILSGRVRSPWTDAYNRRLVSRRRLVKDIRANLLLKWLSTHFPGTPIVFLLRHPFAVVSSRSANTGIPTISWDPYLHELLDQGDLVDDFLTPFVSAARRAETAFERHVWCWCIENYVALRQHRPGEIHVAFYEELCTDPGPAVARLFGFIRQPLDQRVWTALRRPSLLSGPSSAIRIGGDLVGNWQRYITDQEVSKGLQVLSLFGLDRIYSADPMPRREGVEELMLPSSPGLAVPAGRGLV